MTEPDDDLDRRLREHGARWRTGQPPAAPLDVETLQREARPTTARLRAPAAAAAVAAVLVGVLVAVHLGGDAERPPTRPTAVRPGQVVPWRPLPATHPRIPTVTTPADPSPDPQAAAAAAACRASDLRVRDNGVNGAGGTAYLALRLYVASGPSCRLQGYPTVVPHTADDGKPIPVRRMTDDSVYHRPVLVTTRSPGFLQLNWGSEWCDRPIRNDRIELTLPAGGGSLTVAGFGRSSIVCDSPARRDRTPIETRTFEPPLPRPVRVHSAYDGVRVTGDLHLTAQADGTVRFTVTLTSRRRLVLDPCPDFSVTQGQPEPASKAQRFALNCADVPYRDADGRPYLPAGVPVRFAIESDAGAPGARGIRWTLDVLQPPEVVGTITVR